MPNPIPFWALADDTPYPCPCGRPTEMEMALLKGEKGLLRMYHPECLREYVDLEDIDLDGDE